MTTTKLLQICILCLLISFIILGQTLTVPFFTIDDSDVLNRAQQYLNQHGWAGYIKAYIPETGVKRRYWPGYQIFILARTQLFGLNSYLWHLMQVLIFTSIGSLLCLVSQHIIRSIIPGLITLFIILTAGEFSYQTNWFAYVFTNSFEPLLCLLWTISICLFVFGQNFQFKWQLTMVALGTLVALYSITVKENAFIVTGAMSGLVFLTTLVYVRVQMIRWSSAVIAVASVAWGLWVYSVIPKGEGYAGVSTLNTNLGPLLDTAHAYALMLYQSTGMFVPTGIALGLARQISARRFDLTFWFGLAFGIAQIGSVIIWPDSSFRLIFPAFVALVFVSTSEFYQFIKLSAVEHKRWAALIAVTLGVGIFMLASYASSRFFATLPFLLSVLAGAGYWQQIPNQLKFTSRMCGLAAIWFIGFGLIVNGLSHVASYPMLHKTTELTRHLTVRAAASLAPPNAKVVWFTAPGQEIFPYSCDIHAKLFFGREDLEIMPSGSLTTGTTALEQGDMLVLYGKYAAARLSSTGLSDHSVIQGGYISPILSYKDYISWAKSLLSGNMKPASLLGNYYEGGIRMYQVESKSWVIPAELQM